MSSSYCVDIEMNVSIFQFPPWITNNPFCIFAGYSIPFDQLGLDLGSNAVIFSIETRFQTCALYFLIEIK